MLKTVAGLMYIVNASGLLDDFEKACAWLRVQKCSCRLRHGISLGRVLTREGRGGFIHLHTSRAGQSKVSDNLIANKALLPRPILLASSGD